MVTLAEILTKLRRYYGRDAAPRLPSDPFELVLWENVAYLADDEKRRNAFDLLRSSVGTSPEKILAAKPAALLAVTRHGILPARFAEKLKTSARIARDKFGGNLTEVVRRSVNEAKRALRKFPGIGEPGAEKILLFSGQHAFLAPDSNALRVLVRLGFLPDDSNYSRTYNASRKLADVHLPARVDRRMEAHQLLRHHGQTLCRRTRPLCRECPLEKLCPSAKAFLAAAAENSPRAKSRNSE